jgi:hypothetical protein
MSRWGSAVSWLHIRRLERPVADPDSSLAGSGIESADGVVLEELRDLGNPSRAIPYRHPWTRLQLAYFAGCAMWTYLNTPFVLAWPGVVTTIDIYGHPPKNPKPQVVWVWTGRGPEVGREQELADLTMAEP